MTHVHGNSGALRETSPCQLSASMGELHTEPECQRETHVSIGRLCLLLYQQAPVIHSSDVFKA